MLERLQYVKQRFDEISDLIIQPDVIADQKRYVQLNQEYKTLKALMEKREELINVTGNIEEANEILADGSDAEMVEMAKMELDEAKERMPQLEEEIKFLLIPKDPEDAKNVMVEIRAGTGGDEASIFAGDLFRMYTKYCENKGWRTSVVDLNEGTSGGYKEIIFEVTGEDVYGTLKFEAGVHRVQRVPQGSQGPHARPRGDLARAAGRDGPHARHARGGEQAHASAVAHDGRREGAGARASPRELRHHLPQHELGLDRRALEALARP